MASAAAVAADSMESPLDDTTADGVFSGSVHPNDLAAAQSDDDEDSGANGAVNGESEGDEGDLFGDGDDADEQPRRRRELDDEDLDSGDDMDRTDRLPDDEDEAPQGESRTLNLMDIEMPRTALPNGSDGEVRANRTSRNRGIAAANRKPSCTF